MIPSLPPVRTYAANTNESQSDRPIWTGECPLTSSSSLEPRDGADESFMRALKHIFLRPFPVVSFTPCSSCRVARAREDEIIADGVRGANVGRVAQERGRESIERLGHR
jgi:hypothetical protein